MKLYSIINLLNSKIIKSYICIQILFIKNKYNIFFLIILLIISINILCYDNIALGSEENDNDDEDGNNKNDDRDDDRKDKKDKKNNDNDKDDDAPFILPLPFP